MFRTLLLALLSLTPALAWGSDARLTLNEVTFEIEIAITPQERQKGLSGRDSLPHNHGMLFVYHKPSIVSFWMKETRFPLDLLFFDKQGTLLEVIPNLQPCLKIPCPKFTNSEAAVFVLELAAGTAAKYHFRRGDRFHTQMNN